MEKPTLYVESSIFSYYLNEISQNIITAGRQLIAREWWNHYRNQYQLFISDAVLQDITKGDIKEVEKRYTFIEEHKSELKFLEIHEVILQVATLYQHKLGLPDDAKEDAIHLSLTVEYRIEYLLTWNLKHFARHERREQIRRLNKELNKYQPNIVTPQDLISE